MEDFLEQLQQIKQMGPLDNLLEMIPGFNKAAKQFKNIPLDERQLVKAEAIISSMTRKERIQPEIINSSLRQRIAAGSGTTVGC